jgi:hypothetical protein
MTPMQTTDLRDLHPFGVKPRVEKTVKINNGTALGLCADIGSIQWGTEHLINGTVLVYLAGTETSPDLFLRKLGARFEDRLCAGSMAPHDIEKTMSVAYYYALGILHAQRADGTDVPMCEAKELAARQG